MEEKSGRREGIKRWKHTHGFSPLECTSFSSSFLFFSSYSSTLLRMARRASEHKPRACFPQAPARKLVSEIRHFFPPLHSSLERARAPTLAPTSTVRARIPLVHRLRRILSSCKTEENGERERIGASTLDKRSTTKNRASPSGKLRVPFFSLSSISFFLLVLSFFSSSFLFFFSFSPFHVRYFGKSPWASTSQGTFLTPSVYIPSRVHPYALRPSYRDFFPVLVHFFRLQRRHQVLQRFRNNIPEKVPEERTTTNPGERQRVRNGTREG